MGLPDQYLGSLIRPFHLNLVSVVLTCFQYFYTDFPLFYLSFLFPPEVPATGSTANYAAAVVALVAIMALLSWVFDGRKKYTGPRDLDLALARARDARTD